MSKARFVLAMAILFVTAFVFSCGEIDANFCGESQPKLEYSASGEFCFENEVYPKCNDSTYNPLDSFCYKNVLYEKCDGEEVDFSKSFCYGNVRYQKCGGKIYNPLAEYCSGNSLYPNRNRCPDTANGERYDPSKTFCGEDGKIHELCDGQGYNTSREFCFENRPYAMCKNTVGKYVVHDPLQQGCIGGILYPNCNDQNTLGSCADSLGIRIKCRNSLKEIVELSGGMECDDSGKILGKIEHNGIMYNTVQIGKQIWTADDLRGKYDWAKAMNLRTECNDNPYYSTTCQGSLGQDVPCRRARFPECENIDSLPKILGSCPAGWHISNIDEWEKLIEFIENAGGNSTPASKLKGCGFNANENAYWWTSESSPPAGPGKGERKTAVAYSIVGNTAIQSSMRSKEESLSVRCLRDY